MELSSTKVTITDKILAATILPFVPHSVPPNQVTILRLILTPFVVALLVLEYYAIGFVFFACTALTDAIDGAMARTRNQITNWGKIADPVADKLLIGSVAMVLVLRYLGIGITFALLGMEIFIIISAILWRRRGQEIQANIWGKIKMVLQVIGVLVLLLAIILQLPALFSVAFWIFTLALVFAGISIFAYGI